MFSIRKLKNISSFSQRYYSSLNNNFDVVIVGGGSAGIGLLNNWHKHSSACVDHKSGNKFSFAVIEPSQKHYYQPAFTLVGGGITKLKDCEKDTKDFIPKDTHHFNNKVETIEPKNNLVYLSDGTKIEYKVLIVAAGLQINWDQIKGLPEALENYDSPVCSNYSPIYCQKTNRLVKEFNGGNSYFTFPTGPVKCAGAPQKIMYLAHSIWKNKNINCKVHFNSAIGKIFAVEKYGKALSKLCDEKDIIRNFGHVLTEIKINENKAIFKIDKNINSSVKDDFVTVDFDFMHVTPPMSAPSFIKNTGLNDNAGFVNVNKETLQHVEYPNVFALGDCTNLPTSKTVAAVASQIPIVRFRAGKHLQSKESQEYNPQSKEFKTFKTNDGPIYDGYTSCPLPVGDNKGIIAEFNYDLQPQETTFWDQSKPSTQNYLLKAYGLPLLYWNTFVTGDWEGPWKLRKILNRKGEDSQPKVL